MSIDFTHVKDHYAERTHEAMQDVLMDPKAVGPSIHYYMIRGSSEIGNITVWEPGTVGTEYVKTYGHYHVGKLQETYHVLSGTGFALLQKRALNDQGLSIDDMVADFRVIPVQEGSIVHMESGYGHLVVNTGSTFLVTTDDSPVYFTPVDTASLPGHADYTAVKAMRGFAYYVVERDGYPALVKNPLYKEILRSDLASLPIHQGETS
ncbi:MAG: glucose-6-phosphate isomerase family protein [bacterium]